MGGAEALGRIEDIRDPFTERRGAVLPWPPGAYIGPDFMIMNETMRLENSLPGLSRQTAAPAGISSMAPLGMALKPCLNGASR